MEVLGNAINAGLPVSCHSNCHDSTVTTSRFKAFMRRDIRQVHVVVEEVSSDIFDDIEATGIGTITVLDYRWHDM